jgi:tripartite-type tricarboxylate transporter receptor subunit TctC
MAIITGSNSTHVLNAALYSLPYDVLNDFAPISPITMLPYILLAKRMMQVKDLHELIAWLKANPNKALAGFSIASQHVLSAYFQKETATQFTLVPYRGAGPAIQDLIAGQIDIYLGTRIWLSLVRAGSVKAFAVTSERRLNIAPDIPTFADNPAVRSRLVDLGGEILPPERRTPKALRALQKSDVEKWWPIVRAANIRAE